MKDSSGVERRSRKDTGTGDREIPVKEEETECKHRQEERERWATLRGLIEAKTMAACILESRNKKESNIRDFSFKDR